MGFEIELKYRVDDFEDLTRRLMALGAEGGPTLAQEDAYLAHPARDFAATGEALRVRRDGAEAVVTYKGAKLGGPAKTREEIEVPVGDGDQMAVLFDRLGFRPVAVVRKRRRSFEVRFQGRPMTVALDDAEGLGTFAEVEALADSEADLEPAQGAVGALAGALGLAEVEPRSYLRMLLETAGRL